MVSDENYILTLIESVRKHPVLYEVDLIDYKNKNKKGEAFKEVQIELLGAGCTDFQAQCTYKKWISLKRKFRVEYFRLQSEESLTGTPCTSNFRFYNDLMFLVPYCDYYKNLKSTSKRKCGDDDEESDEDRLGTAKLDESINCSCSLSTLDEMLSSKRVKLEEGNLDSQIFFQQLQNQNQLYQKKNNSFSVNANGDAECLSTASILSLNNGNHGKMPTTTDKFLENEIHIYQAEDKHLIDNKIRLENTIAQQNKPNAFPFNPTSVLTQREILSFQKKCHLTQTSKNAKSPSINNFSEKTPILDNYLKESENSLFGRLVANEIDKLPKNMHNIVRAQVLLLLAHTTSSTTNITTTANKLFPIPTSL